MTDYYEFHVEVRVPDPAQLVELAAIADRHDSRLSRSDRSDDGAQRFVTLRVHSDRAIAEARFDALVLALRAKSFVIVDSARASD